jgi:hypothetical protein
MSKKQFTIKQIIAKLWEAEGSVAGHEETYFSGHTPVSCIF